MVFSVQESAFSNYATPRLVGATGVEPVVFMRVGLLRLGARKRVGAHALMGRAVKELSVRVIGARVVLNRDLNPNPQVKDLLLYQVELVQRACGHLSSGRSNLDPLRQEMGSGTKMIGVPECVDRELSHWKCV